MNNSNQLFTEVSKTNHDNVSSNMLFHKPVKLEYTFSNTATLPMAMLFYPPPGEACYLEWQLEQLIAHHFDIIYIYINMDMKNYTKMPHTIQHLQNLINIGTVYNMDSIDDH